MYLFGRSAVVSPTQSGLTPVCSVVRAVVLPRLIFFCLATVVTALLLGSAIGSRGAAVVRPTLDDGIHIDPPANGHLRVENPFGNVDVRVANERDILVSATIEDSIQSANYSPVVVETKPDFLLISVVRPSNTPTARINLTVRIPIKIVAHIITKEGSIVSHGLPLGSSFNTDTGQIRAELDSPLDVSIVAESSGGVIRSQIDATPNADVHHYNARFGRGVKVLRASSQGGDIIFTLADSPSQTDPKDSTAPQLRTGNDSRGAGTPANQTAVEEVDEADVIRVDAQLVTLNLSVVDRGTNRGLVGLNQSDFKLFEAGVEQRILRFESSSAPFDLVLVIDLSGSTRDVVKLIRAAARHFVDAARPSDRIGIITFAGHPTLVSPLTLDRVMLRQRVDSIDTLAGDTKLYDATDFTLAEITRETKNSRRTAIVLMSDGLDGSIEGVQGDGSQLAYKELLNTLREFDGVLYTIWLNTYYEALNPQDTQPEAFDEGYDRMKEMAEVGGGFFYEVERLEDLAGAYERVVSDLGTVYSLAYRPLNKTRDGKWRGITVAVDRKNAVARGKHGYYAN